MHVPCVLCQHIYEFVTNNCWIILLTIFIRTKQRRTRKNDSLWWLFLDLDLYLLLCFYSFVKRWSFLCKCFTMNYELWLVVINCGFQPKPEGFNCAAKFGYCYTNCLSVVCLWRECILTKWLNLGSISFHWEVHIASAVSVRSLTRTFEGSRSRAYAQNMRDNSV